MKVCNTCGKEKSNDSFYVNRNQCKVCRYEIRRENEQKNATIVTARPVPWPWVYNGRVYQGDAHVQG